jgi:HEAT repeat protein
VNEAIARLLESTDAPTRSLALALVTGRRIEAALPVLVKMSAGTDAAAAAEAVKALPALGTPAELPGLVKILVAQSDGGLRTAVEGAASSICTRATDREACGQALIPALDLSAAPAARIAILGLLPRVKTAAALAAAQKVLAQEADAEVRQAALRALADWPDLTAAPALLAAAKAPKGPTDAVVALRGCLRLAGFKDQPVAERFSMYRSVLELAARPDEKKQALAGLADLPSPDALTLLTKYLSDPALAADAAQATLRFVKQVGVAYRRQAEAALNQLKAQPGLAPELKAQADDAMKGLSGATMTSGGFILAWMLSGPYTQEGKSGAELFDVAFPPEKTGGGEWRVITVPANAATPGLVELNVILGGDERVAYPRTQVTTAKAQDAVLECGSDDGIKIWLNGQQVHANNATRGCRPGEDKVKLKLKPGANTLLLKVTQGAGEWAAIAHLVGPDGKPLDATIAPQ